MITQARLDDPHRKLKLLFRNPFHADKNTARWAALYLKAARLFPAGCWWIRLIWMSPVSTAAPSKCHWSGRYMPPMQSCVNAKSAPSLLDISGKLTIKNCPSFAIIVLRNYSFRFMFTDGYMHWVACVYFNETEKGRKWEKGRRSDNVRQRKTQEAE